MTTFGDHNGSVMHPNRLRLEDHTADQRRRATRFVAFSAHHADDAQQLLSALGLTAQEGPTR